MRTYGTLEYKADKRSYVIECEPHVALVLKRVFPKLARHSQGRHWMTDTLQTSMDLAWFLKRYPMEVKGLEHLEEQARLHQEGTTLVEDLLSMRVIPQPFSLAVPAREYQSLAANVWLTKRNLLLADDVGLGKTATAICGFTDPRTLPALVVTMTHLPRQWQSEIEKFAPNLKTHIVKKGTPYDLTQRRRGQQMLIPDTLPDVLIINYHKLGGWAETLSKIVKTVVFDECQELRNDKSANGLTQKYAAAKQIAGHCQYRIGLSATPIYNYGEEMFNVMDVLSPGALGARDEFIREWCSFAASGKYKIKDPKSFGSFMREGALMIRRTRADVGRELPPIVKIHHRIDADTEALDKVENSCAELARIILAQAEDYKGQKMESAGQLDNIIRQATGIAKAPYVAEAVKLIVESGEKVVLYGWHRSVYDIWMERLKEFNPVMYTGSESVTQKEEAKRKFVSGGSQVFIVSLRSGAGLDGLQHVTRTVCFGELDWSPGVHEQNIGRVARDGQDEHTMVYFFVSDSGSDPTMAEVLGIKKMQVEGIRGDKQELVEVLQTDGNHIKRLAEMYLKKHQAVAS